MKISPSGQVRIPKYIMEKLSAYPGDYLDFSFEEGHICIKAKKLIDADQLWFWDQNWQKKEKKADEDIKKGRTTKTFKAYEEGISFLKKALKKQK